MSKPARKFTFDTEFKPDGDIVSAAARARQKKTLTNQELDDLRAAAVAEGLSDGQVRAAESLTSQVETLTAAITRAPTALEPVKEIFATSGCTVIGAPTRSPVPVMMLSTPGGRPISAAMTPSSSSTTGVISDGFSTTVQPAASAGATFQEVVTSGKFQGTIRLAMPAGSRRRRAPKAASGTGTVRFWLASRSAASSA